ncbi:hypothetical protein GcM3_193029 [Golovinomyces cichoracearum]|uniref:CCHC-type domain-containing protein n=1 Tax=Golovinomyces cichoracearum TaxID=62708 RepID=A0A420HH27_9PEZI|nr:hypothetical protein GcM3_193029 [Golovinomyces cichoracearum]
MKGNYHAKWAVKFSGPPPSKFVKQMTCGNEKVRVKQEPYSTCRFCGNSGHTLSECTDTSELELGPETWDGQVGEPDNEKDYDDEMAEDSNVEDKE